MYSGLDVVCDEVEKPGATTLCCQLDVVDLATVSNMNS